MKAESAQTSGHDYPIPGMLNLLIATLQLAGLLSLLWAAGHVSFGWGLLLVALGYGLIMNSAYAMLHEAEHGMLHPNRVVNETAGTILALFFPAPFHLLRQGHLGHHLRNRSDDEAFDFYFEGENVIWKYWLLYGILTGGFWLCIALGNFLILLLPGCIKPAYTSFDRPTQALIEKPQSSVSITGSPRSATHRCAPRFPYVVLACSRPELFCHAFWLRFYLVRDAVLAPLRHG